MGVVCLAGQVKCKLPVGNSELWLGLFGYIHLGNHFVDQMCVFKYPNLAIYLLNKYFYEYIATTWLSKNRNTTNT